MKTILIAGGTGLIGRRLAGHLEEAGYGVRILSRRPEKNSKYPQFYWNPAKGEMDMSALVGVTGVVNLAGENIAAKRWTAARKTAILNSRIDSARTISRAAKEFGVSALVYVSASAVGYYGDRGATVVSEGESPQKGDFAAEVCRIWEDEAAQTAGSLKARLVILRIGIVLDPAGGALHEMVKPLRFGIGAYFGNGAMWTSWIHAADVCRMIRFVIERCQVEGVYNCAAPAPTPNKKLVQAICEIRQKPALVVSAPTFILRLLLGELSGAILASIRVSVSKISDLGFRFAFPDLESALRDLILEKKHMV